MVLPRLPDGVVAIIKQCSKYQPLELLRDITSFYSVRDTLIKRYHYVWVTQLEEHPPEHLYRLLDDIYSILNNGVNIYYPNTNIRLPRLQGGGSYSPTGGVVCVAYATGGLQCFKLNNYTFLYLASVRNREIKSEINILLGLLTPTERNRLLYNLSL